MAMYKWFRAQAGSEQPGTTENVRALMRHPAFDASDGWTCSAVLMGFADSVPNFHAVDGSGYRFLADAILEVRQDIVELISCSSMRNDAAFLFS
jgi:aminopeptidase N